MPTQKPGDNPSQLTDGEAFDGLTFRDATAADALAIARLHSESWQSAYRGLLTDAYLDGPLADEHRARWQDLLAADGDAGPGPGEQEAGSQAAETAPPGQKKHRPEGFVFVAEQAGRLLGFISVWFDYKEGYDTYVDNLHVRPGLRGGGIGGRMLREAAARVIAEGRKSLSLEVLNENLSAISFYRKMGGVSREHGREDMGGAMVDYHLIAWDDARKLVDSAAPAQ
ncbi:GNAT family N-acetyltransferase [Pelagibius sp. Alg239-R121]|uniref:GNAT family N-acetyltransferase n=1 Tax=Pelagibius sp. Alg239-R121 TaxID=2993448 RepID=UPI0024A6D356|nr:GNAT family N-acetyltransferase [Pelagibius sp. Alg239-R121]